MAAKSRWWKKWVYGNITQQLLSISQRLSEIGEEFVRGKKDFLLQEENHLWEVHMRLIKQEETFGLNVPTPNGSMMGTIILSFIMRFRVKGGLIILSKLFKLMMGIGCIV